VETRRAGEAVALVRQRNRRQGIALPIFVRLPMEGVGAAARDHLNLAAAISSEFRRIGLGLYLELACRFRSYPVIAQSYAGVVVIDAVQQEIVIASALAVDGHARRPGAASGSGSQQRKLVYIPRAGRGGDGCDESLR